MDEFELIRRHFVRPGIDPDIVTGIGDDGAVLRLAPGRELVTVVDTLVEGVHFPEESDPADIGYRAVAVNLSDIAAMGARPRWMTLALTLHAANDSWLVAFSDGLRAAADEYGVELIGGDTTSGPCVVVSVQISGDVASGKAILRSGARAGDTIFVTGTVGDAAGGLELLRECRPHADLSRRFFRPAARVEFGQSLAGVASAAIDISDGLFGDLQKMLTASGVGGVIDLDALPASAALQASFDAATVRRLALSGGDDYELCFTANADRLPDSKGLLVTAIGTVTEQSGLVCRDSSGVVDYNDSGYLHFQ